MGLLLFVSLIGTFGPALNQGKHLRSRPYLALCQESCGIRPESGKELAQGRSVRRRAPLTREPGWLEEAAAHVVGDERGALGEPHPPVRALEQPETLERVDLGGAPGQGTVKAGLERR